MDTNVTVAIVSTSGAVVVGLGALAVNAYWIGRAFDSINKRIDRLEQQMERRLDLIEQDLKQFYGDIVQIKLKIGLEN